MADTPYDDQLVDHYCKIPCLTFRDLLEATVKQTMFNMLDENTKFYESTMSMNANIYVEGRIYDC